jgi:hypothetical protein
MKITPDNGVTQGLNGIFKGVLRLFTGNGDEYILISLGTISYRLRQEWFF